MNRVIIGRERSGRHPAKGAALDILSLADQLYRSRSTFPEGPEPGKIYFSENPAPNLLLYGMKALPTQVEAFNRSLEKNKIEDDAVDNPGDRVTTGSRSHPIEHESSVGTNEAVNELFLSAREASGVTSELAEFLFNRDLIVTS